MENQPNTREGIESEYNYLIFDHFIDQFQAGECSYDEAIEAYHNVKAASEHLGRIAISKLQK